MFSVHVVLTICLIPTKQAIQEFMAFFKPMHPNLPIADYGPPTGGPYSAMAKLQLC